MSVPQKRELRTAIPGPRSQELHQRTKVPGQEYSFRYFQQLTGSVMLPKDFTPQRVRVLLRGNGGNAEQTFDWKTAGSGGGR